MNLANTKIILCSALFIFVAIFFLNYSITFAQCTVEYYYETGTFHGSFATNEMGRTEAAATELLMYDISKSNSENGSKCPPPIVDDIVCNSGCCTYSHWCDGPWFHTTCITGTYTVNYTMPLEPWRATWDVVCPSTLINLSSFTATPKSGKVILEWSTESEIDNAGFNIYRGTTEDGDYRIINDSLIPTEGSATQGAIYEYTDTGLRNGKTYYYKLEDVDLNGVNTIHEAANATPRWWYGIRK